MLCSLKHPESFLEGSFIVARVAEALPFLGIGRTKDVTRRTIQPLPRDALTYGIRRDRDNTGARTLTGASYTDTTNMTVEACVNYCIQQEFVYAGVEYASQCCTPRPGNIDERPDD